MNNQHYIVYSFKALADETRLSMVRLLAKGEHTVKEMAEKLGVTEPTISHHLTKLRAVGFLSLRMDGNQRFYTLDERNFARFKANVNEVEQYDPTPEELPDSEWIDALPFDAAAKKVLRDYTFGVKLKQLPTKEKKLLAVLDWVATYFEAGRVYSETEVNSVIEQVFHDYVTLRRELVDMGYLRRERGGSQYWLATTGDVPQPSTKTD